MPSVPPLGSKHVRFTVGQVDEAESGVGARAVPGQGTAQAAAVAISLPVRLSWPGRMLHARALFAQPLLWRLERSTPACSQLAPAPHSSAVSDNHEATPLQKKALASLGRNVLHFQRAETPLKQLVLLCDFSAPVSGFAARHAERKEELRTTTMGSLVNELHRQLYGKLPEPESEQALNEIVIRVGLKIEADPDYIARQKQQLTELVHERKLSHPSGLAEFDPNSEESCRRLITRLDEQNQRILAQHQALRQVLDTQQRGFSEIMAVVGSEEFARQLQLQSNPQPAFTHALKSPSPSIPQSPLASNVGVARPRFSFPV